MSLLVIIGCSTKGKKNATVETVKTDSIVNPPGNGSSSDFNFAQYPVAQRVVPETASTPDSVYCLESDSNFVSLLYPEAVVLVVPDKTYSKWFIDVSSLYSAGGFDFLTWSEFFNPTASTQFEEWHWGGIAALENGVLIDTMMRNDLVIYSISDSNKYISIDAESEGSFHGDLIVRYSAYIFPKQVLFFRI